MAVESPPAANPGEGPAAPRRPRRRLRIALVVVGAVAALLALNTLLVELETEPADPDVGRIVELPEGDVQVREDGPRGARPLVLLHGFTASLRWWDQVTPALARRHRVVRIDLLGHGGSEKPRDGYSMEEQADLVAAALERLRVGRAAVVGHSMGGQVAAALAERHPALVERLMLVSTAPENRSNRTTFTRKLTTAPVIGHALSRVAPDSTVHREVDRAFADGTRVPDLLYDDFERTTYNSYSGSRRGALDYRDERSLDRRLRGADRLFCVVLGSEDELIDGPGAARDWRALPGARIALLAGAGHSPMVEDPAATARRIDRFATASSGTPPAESCPAG